MRRLGCGSRLATTSVAAVAVKRRGSTVRLSSRARAGARLLRGIPVTGAAILLFLLLASTAQAAISYQTSVTNSATNAGSLSLSMPTGTSQNDLLLTQLTFNGGTTATITLPVQPTVTGCPSPEPSIRAALVEARA